MESYQKSIYRIIRKMSGQANILSVNRMFAKITKSLDGGIFLSQLLYWSDKTEDPEGWFYKSDDEWAEEIFISRRQVNKFTNLFTEAGFLETKLKKDPRGTPKTHYRVLQDSFFAWLVEEYNKLAAETEKPKQQVEQQEPEPPITPPATPIQPQPEKVEPPVEPPAQPKAESKPKQSAAKPQPKLEPAAASYRPTSGWRAEANKQLDPKVRVPLVNELEKMHGLSAMLNLNDTEDEGTLQRVNFMAIRLYRMGYTSPEKLQTLFDLWKADPFYGKNNRLPWIGKTSDKDALVIFASQQAAMAENRKESAQGNGNQYAYFEIDWDAIERQQTGDLH